MMQVHLPGLNVVTNVPAFLNLPAHPSKVKALVRSIQVAELAGQVPRL